MRLILDTNCYLSYLNRRVASQHEQMTKFWESASRVEYEVLLTGHNLSEIAFVLQSVYEVRAGNIHTILSDLLANPGVTFQEAYYPELILELWPRSIKDYGDAVIAAAALSLKARVLTFDRSFSRSLKKLGCLAEIL